MQRRAFGSSSRLTSVVGQGTWNLDGANRAAALATLRRGLDLGLAHIDTAEMYGSGAAERLVGEAVAGRRDEAFIVSKVLPQNASRAGVRSACERSLKNLNTDRIDCYLLHWRGGTPLSETFAAFEDLLRTGKILSWGVSNFDVSDLDEAFAIAGPGRIACNQVLYHLKERAIEHAVLPWCEAHGVALTAYSPFGQQDFPKAASPGGGMLAQIGAAHGASARQAALAFLARSPATFVIPKASSLAHVEDNAGGGDLVLSEAECATIDKAFPRGARRGGLPML